MIFVGPCYWLRYVRQDWIFNAFNKACMAGDMLEEREALRLVQAAGVELFVEPNWW